MTGQGARLRAQVRKAAFAMQEKSFTSGQREGNETTVRNETIDVNQSPTSA